MQEALERFLERISPSSLAKAQEILSRTYREGRPSGDLFRDEAARVAYLATRCPPIYGVLTQIFQEFRSRFPTLAVRYLLDLGAGPGTASWAALSHFPELQHISLYEMSQEALALSKELARETRLEKIGTWICQSMEGEGAWPKADAAVLSYSLGELKRPEALLKNLWNSEISTLILVEPGTPRGYGTILKARSLLLSLGASLLAPCPHAVACPLREGNWCHFSARIVRSKIHRYLKGGSLGYEDEKYSFLIVSREGPSLGAGSRILRHPIKNPGHVRLTLCTPNGEETERVVSKKDKELYRQAKDAEWGSLWPPSFE